MTLLLTTNPKSTLTRAQTQETFNHLWLMNEGRAPSDYISDTSVNILTDDSLTSSEKFNALADKFILWRGWYTTGDYIHFARLLMATFGHSLAFKDYQRWF